MSTPAAEQAAPRRPGLGLGLCQWRLPAIETHPGWLAFAQTLPGKLLLFAAFGVLMRQTGLELWLPLTIAAAIVSLAGERRNLAAVLCTGAILVLDPDWFQFRAVDASANQEGLLVELDLRYVQAGTLLACAPFAAGMIYLARRFRDHPLGGRPVVLEHALRVGLIALATSRLLSGLPQVILWSVTAVFAAYFWFLAYALIDQRQREPAPFLLQLATFHPFFGSLTTPMGKGAAYWRSVEATSEETLAATQLKGTPASDGRDPGRARP
jgi:hypothetical protein